MAYRLIETNFGRFFANPHDRWLSRCLIRHGEFSWDEQLLLRALAPRGALVVEVGANIGAHTVPLAQHIGPAGRIVAFEPQTTLHGILCANAAINGLTNVTANRAAVGRERGTIVVPELDPNEDHNFGGLELAPGTTDGTPTPVVSLDELGIAGVQLLKVDVEGMELDVLEGARGMIRAARPAIYIENDRRDKSEALVRLLFELDYACYWHLPPLARPQTWNAGHEDEFMHTVSVNMLCVPLEVKAEVKGLERLAQVTDRPAGEAEPAAHGQQDTAAAPE